MIVATIIVRTPSGATRSFEADRVTMHDGLVTATGRWRGTRDRRRRQYTWSQQSLLEIRWARERVVA
jgi:hypothetical protein